MRVLLVGRAAPEQGGIAVFLEGLLDSSLSDDVHLSLLNLTPQVPAPPGVFSLSNVFRTFADGWRVLRRAGTADLVHIHSALGATSTTVRAGWLGLCARLRGRPVILHAHGGKVIEWLESARSRAVLRVAVLPFHEVIAVSDRVAASVRPVVSRPVSFIPNGVDTDRYGPLPDAPRAVPARVVYVGHLARRKGLVDLRDASRILRSRGVEHVVVVVGGTPDEGAEEQRIVQDEIRREVTLLGRIEHEEIPGILATATVFCLPSWWEATPLSVLEAMAAGRPVVATDVGDLSDMIVDGVSGTLVPPRDPVALAAALEALLLDPERCAAYGRAGRQRAVDLFDAGELSRRLRDRYFAAVGTPTRDDILDAP